MREFGPGHTPQPIHTRLGRNRRGRSDAYSERVKREEIRGKKNEYLWLVSLRVIAIDDVRRLRDVDANEKVMLYTLACYLDPHHKVCNVSYTELAQDSGLSRRQVIRVVEQLERRGLVRVYHSPGGAHEAANFYQFNFCSELRASGEYLSSDEVLELAKQRAKRLKDEGKTDKTDRETLLECWRGEINELLYGYIRGCEESSRNDFRDWPALQRRFAEQLGKYGVEADGITCCMITKSREYGVRRCQRPAVYGLLCGIHYRFRWKAAQAREQKRLQEVAARPVSVPDPVVMT
jgi:DNA-binding Lrp family transcriptional regulator